MKRRSTSLTSTRVAPETQEAFREVHRALGLSSTQFRLRSAAAFAGEVETTHGKLSEVVDREMTR